LIEYVEKAIITNRMQQILFGQSFQLYPIFTIMELFIEVVVRVFYADLIVDLKPENLLFRTPAEDSDLLIADFGLSRIIDEESFHVLTTTCGTPGYMAPEIFKKTGHSKPVDIWALGVITYFLLCGYTPFDRDSNVEEMQAIMAGDYSFEPPEYWEDVSEKAKEFIKGCLTVDPSQRLTAKQCVSHPWLSREPAKKETDLLPTVRSNFNARRFVVNWNKANCRRTFHVAFDAIKAINIMKNGGAMDGAFSHSPQAVRDPPKPELEKMDTVEEEDTRPPSHTAGLWQAHEHN